MSTQVFRDAYVLIGAIALLAFGARAIEGAMRAVRRPAANGNIPALELAVCRGTAIGVACAAAGALLLIALFFRS